MVFKKNRILKLIILFISFVYLYQTNQNEAINLTSKNLEVKISSVKVKRVIDGDTIQLENGEKVRYIGINTPEINDKRSNLSCYGEEARLQNKKLVENKEIRLIKDVSDKDKYGRLLRYVYVNNLFVNLELVKQGFAQVSTYPPDIKHQQEFILTEQKARREKIGLWNKCQIKTKTNLP